MKKNPLWILTSLLLCLLTPVVVFAAELYDPPVVYLTWQRSPETTMTIQWLTQPKRTDDTIEYHVMGETEWRAAKGLHYDLPEKLPYLLHRVELTGLLPDTMYEFRPGSDAEVFKFKTMPAQLNGPIRFVAGGDVYHDDLHTLSRMNRQAAKTNPHFALVGGDLTYAEEIWGFMKFLGIFKDRSIRWIEWLKAWKKQMVAPDGRLIPMIPAIGNHDTHGRFNQSPAQAPVFYALFPMPGLRGCNVLDFGDYLSIFILDTGHTHPIEGMQTQWLKQALEARQNRLHKIALYHVGAYPSVRHYHIGYSTVIRKNWVPLFEQYGLNTAFEHHDHCYKRTYLIKNGKIDPEGVLYLGDGAWGIAEPRKPKKDRWYLAKTASTQNVITAILDKTRRSYTAISSHGRIIDTFEQPVKPRS